MEYQKTKKQSSSNRKGRTIVSMILSFLIAVTLTMAALLGSLRLGFLNEKMIVRSLNVKDYYGVVCDDFYERVEDLSIPLGIPKSALEGIVDTNSMYNDIRASLEASLTGQTYQPDTGKLRTKLKENVENYAKSREIELGEAQQTVLNTYLEQAAEQYVRATKIPFIEYYGRIHSFAEKVITVGILGCLVFAVLAGIVLFRMYIWKHHAMRYLVYSTLASGMMIGLVPAYLLLAQDYRRLVIEPEYLYQFMVTYVTNGLLIFEGFAMGFFGIAALLLLRIASLRRRLIKNSRG
ncbi:MAG: hypothetical protein SPF03_00525 [Faecalimonas umbilicata]|uniref:Uncharacterized protein n=1 Tax=Faecalimonas umbilicata TaxID=1912855 RepID=A0A4V2UQC0_9FIRM|nr:hypothetical protein [Faecalimonas umbilicata]MCI5986296.1 hypothetical protein [Faecalimonas umbilicata]MDY5091995.1 hypothetical protein [Faecalimonas umbilicata]TCS69668.1 hypothetical protein EDD74_103118 [Faecalimonas umbilicata]GBU05916.1 hypothetical protein FAEUMB_24570 [Faecalimonas umbilicata]